MKIGLRLKRKYWVCLSFNKESSQVGTIFVLQNFVGLPFMYWLNAIYWTVITMYLNFCTPFRTIESNFKKKLKLIKLKVPRYTQTKTHLKGISLVLTEINNSNSYSLKIEVRPFGKYHRIVLKMYLIWRNKKKSYKYTGLT